MNSGLKTRFIKHLKSLIECLDINIKDKDFMFSNGLEMINGMFDIIAETRVSIDVAVDDSDDILVISFFLSLNEFNIYIDLYNEETSVDSWLMIFKNKDIIIAYDGTIEKTIKLISKVLNE